MKNKKRVNGFLFRLVGIMFICLFCINIGYAMTISEIQFDPAGADTDREWIEVFNESPGNVDLTSYKFFENNTNHSLEIVSGDKNLGSGEYAVIVQDLNKFKLDYPGFVGKIFKSSFSLSNSGEILSLKDREGNTTSSVNYTSSASLAGNGFTLSVGNTGLFKTEPTPGTGDLLVGGNNSNSSNNTVTSTSTAGVDPSNISTTSTSSEIYVAPTYYHRSYIPESEKIYVDAGQNRISLAGAPVSFSARAVNGQGKALSEATFFWSFGDGESGEGKTISHVYKFTGEYTIDVEAYYNGAKSNQRIYTKIIEPQVSILLKKIDNEPVVELLNKTKDEIDLGGFLVKSGGGEYEYTSTLAKNFSLLPGKNISISQATLKIATNTQKVSLLTGSGRLISEYSLVSPALGKLGKLSLTLSTTTSSATKPEFSGAMTKEKWELAQALVKSNKSVSISKTYSVAKSDRRKPEPKKQTLAVKADNLLQANVSDKQPVFVIENNNSNLDTWLKLFVGF